MSWSVQNADSLVITVAGSNWWGKLKQIACSDKVSQFGMTCLFVFAVVRFVKSRLKCFNLILHLIFWVMICHCRCWRLDIIWLYVFDVSKYSKKVCVSAFRSVSPWWSWLGVKSQLLTCCLCVYLSVSLSVYFSPSVVNTHTCTRARTHTHMHARSRSRAHTHTHTHTQTHTQTLTHVHACTHAR